MIYDSIIFDLDGTLWDSTMPVYYSWNQVFETLSDIKSAPTIEQLQGVMGMGSVELMATLYPLLTAERGREVFDLCTVSEIAYLREHGATLYDGLLDMLKALSSKLPLFIVSNCPDGYIESFLFAHLTGAYFKDFECIGRTGQPKAENIKTIISRNHLKSPVYVGDTQLDKESSLKAGVPFIYADYGFGHITHTPSIQKPVDLIPLIL